MRDLQRANDLAVHSLKEMSFDGDVFAAEIESVPELHGPVTEKHTADRQRVLSSRTTAMGKHAVTGGCHLNSNDIFKAVEMEARAVQIKERERERKARIAFSELEKRAKAAIARVNGNNAILKATELVDLLKWHGFSKEAIGLKPQNLAAWQIICEGGEQSNPPEGSKLAPWTEEDEKEFEEFKNKKIEMKDTALGRREEMKRRELRAAVPTMTREELDELKKEIAEAERIDPSQRGLAI